MCLTSIGKILEIDGKTALVQLRKSKREVRIDLLDVQKGDYIYISGNLGVEKVDKEVAEQTLKEWKNIDKRNQGL